MHRFDALHIFLALNFVVILMFLVCVPFCFIPMLSASELQQVAAPPENGPEMLLAAEAGASTGIVVASADAGKGAAAVAIRSKGSGTDTAAGVEGQPVYTVLCHAAPDLEAQASLEEEGEDGEDVCCARLQLLPLIFAFIAGGVYSLEELDAFPML